MTHPSPAGSRGRWLRIAYLAAGVIGVAVTLLPRGGTLIYLWPWPLVLTLGLVVPPAAFLIRLIRGDAAPRPDGLAAAMVTGLAILLLLSAAFSPYHGAAIAMLLLPLSAIGLFFEVIGWRQTDDQTDSLLERAFGWMLVAFTLDSLALWLGTIVIPDGFNHLWEARNPHPLGHSNYTAGAILLLLPFGLARTWRATGRNRMGWSVAVVLALCCLFTAGSRAAILGLGAGVVAGGILLVRAHLLPARRALLVAGICCLGAVVFAIANPRIRDLLRASPHVVPDDSTLQRRAMLDAGKLMVEARPLLGWGPGTTPLVYPRFRADVAGGVDTALQLHDTPVQIAADLGVTGLILSIGLAIAVAGAAWRSCGDPPNAGRLPIAAVAGAALAAYGMFAIYDFEFDVPFFLFATVIAAALVFPPGRTKSLPRWPAFVLASVALATGIGGRVPALYSHWLLAQAADALEEKNADDFRKLAERSANADPTDTAALNALGFYFGEQAAHANVPAERIPVAREAARYFSASLQRNPDQEIAETNLAWVLLPDDPGASERHFLRAAEILPEKEGLGVGLARARLAQGNRDAAVRALVAEILMDPPYLFSPDWREAPLQELRGQVFAAVASGTGDLARDSRLQPWQHSAVTFVGALADWLAGRKSAAEVATVALSPEQRRYFASGEAQALVDSLAKPGGDLLLMRARRPGYGVLMRNLDAPMPADFYRSKHDRVVVEAGTALVPARLHLPGRILLAELQRRPSAGP